MRNIRAWNHYSTAKLPRRLHCVIRTPAAIRITSMNISEYISSSLTGRLFAEMDVSLHQRVRRPSLSPCHLGHDLYCRSIPDDRWVKYFFVFLSLVFSIGDIIRYRYKFKRQKTNIDKKLLMVIFWQNSPFWILGHNLMLFGKICNFYVYLTLDHCLHHSSHL